MTVYSSVVVPAIPPRPPPLSLCVSAVRPDDTSDPSSAPLDAAQLAALPQDLRDELQAMAAGTDGRPMWVRGFAYAPENHYPADVRDGCDFTSVDRPALNAPTGLALTAHVGGGTVTAAAHAYQVTAVNANGETTALAPVAITLASIGTVSMTWAPVANGVTYKIYGRVAGSIGLLATVGPFDDDQTPSYTDTGTPAPGAVPPVSNTTGGPGAYTNLAINTIVPYLIVAEDSCSSFGFEERDFKGRALRLLKNAAPQAIEAEFWSGTLAQAKGYPNRYLTDSNLVDLTPGGGPPSVARGQQILQDYIASQGFGGQGMIHCQPQTAPSLLNARRLGPLLLDIFDNIIVPGVGYPGTAAGIGTPAAGTAVMIASDLVMVREEDEGTVFPDTFSEALDRGQAGQPNTIRFRAEEFAAAYFDGAIQAGVRVTLAT
jgi:hypothetical protein